MVMFEIVYSASVGVGNAVVGLRVWTYSGGYVMGMVGPRNMGLSSRRAEIKEGCRKCTKKAVFMSILRSLNDSC
jgi:hypothetical protein